MYLCNSALIALFLLYYLETCAHKREEEGRLCALAKRLSIINPVMLYDFQRKKGTARFLLST